MFKKKATPPTDSIQPESKPGMLAKIRAELENELQIARSFDAEMAKASAVIETLTRQTASSPDAEVQGKVESARASLRAMREAAYKNREKISEINRRLDHYQKERARFIARGDRLSAELAPYEPLVERLTACITELKAIGEQITGQREWPSFVESIHPVAGLLVRIKQKQTELIKVRDTIAELGE